MPSTFPVELVTPQGVMLKEEAEALIIPAHEGYLGIMAHHAPMIADLQIGEVVVTLPGGSRRYFAVVGGVCEVRDNQVVILADVGEAAEDIDIQRAQAAAERARKRLRGDEVGEDIDVQRAQLALARALNRLKVSSDSGV